MVSYYPTFNTLVKAVTMETNDCTSDLQIGSKLIITLCYSNHRLLARVQLTYIRVIGRYTPVVAWHIKLLIKEDSPPGHTTCHHRWSEQVQHISAGVSTNCCTCHAPGAADILYGVMSRQSAKVNESLFSKK